jgi:hypothetical protein
MQASRAWYTHKNMGSILSFDEAAQIDANHERLQRIGDRGMTMDMFSEYNPSPKSADARTAEETRAVVVAEIQSKFDFKP